MYVDITCFSFLPRHLAREVFWSSVTYYKSSTDTFWLNIEERTILGHIVKGTYISMPKTGEVRLARADNIILAQTEKCYTVNARIKESKLSSVYTSSIITLNIPY